MGNHPSGTHSDSDEDDYETPPETLDSDNDLEEENDNPNVPENSDDKISEDEDIEDLQNRPENDTAISVGNFLNFPDLLRLNKSGQDTINSEMTHSANETFPPSKSRGARPKKPLPIGSWPRRNNPPLREVILPQLEQTPCPRGVCVPPYDEPPELWCGFGSQDQLMDFLADKIPSYDEEEQSVTNTVKLQPSGNQQNLHCCQVKILLAFDERRLPAAHTILHSLQGAESEDSNQSQH